MRYRDVFQRKNSLIVVIHVDSEEQVLRNIKIADENGANGVFLINHSMSFCSLLAIYQIAKNIYPDFWIGVNLLDLKPVKALAYVPADASGLWVDDIGIDEDADDPVKKARAAWEVRQERDDWNGLYFGGVSFKYKKAVRDDASVARQAMSFADIITTSGQATGHPPSVEKIVRMREAIGDFPLAIASGMDPVNVSEYCNLADCFLVASSISRSFFELEPILVRKFAKAIE